MPPYVTPPDGNVFEDSGLPAGEARHLEIRSTLLLAAARFIAERGLTQAQAAKLMGVSQPRISDLVRARIDSFTVDSPIDMPTNTGVPVEVRAAGNIA